MLRRMGILGCFAVIVALGLFLVSRERPGEEDRVPGARDATGSRGESARRAVELPGAGPDRAGGAPAEASSGWVIHGRLVRHPDGDALEPAQPVAGALVRLAAGKKSVESRPDFPPRETRSGPDGRYGFEGVPGKARYRLDVDAEGCALRALGFELGALGGAATKAIPDIALEEPVSLVVILKGPGEALRDDGIVTASRSERRSYSLRGEKRS